MTPRKERFHFHQHHRPRPATPRSHPIAHAIYDMIVHHRLIADAIAILLALLIPTMVKASCDLLPPPFALSGKALEEKLQLRNHVPKKGYVSLPAFKGQCEDLDRHALAELGLLDGRLVQVKFSRLLSGKADVDAFNAFVESHVAPLPAGNERKPGEEGYRGLRADWKLDGYRASYAVSPVGEDANGIFQASLKLTSEAFLKKAEEHYMNEEMGVR